MCLRVPLAKAGGLVVNLTDRANEEGWEDYIAHGSAKMAIEAMTSHFNSVWKGSAVRHMNKRNAACVALRLPMVLAPDGLSEQQEANLYRKFGEPIGTAAVCKAVLELSRTNRVDDVVELTYDGMIGGIR